MTAMTLRSAEEGGCIAQQVRQALLNAACKADVAESLMRGRTIRLSKSRRTVIDLLYFANQLPTVPVQRRMGLAAVVAARAACRGRPQWSAIFTKAYALTARELPELRRAYVKFPWPHLYE